MGRTGEVRKSVSYSTQPANNGKTGPLKLSIVCVSDFLRCIL